MHEQKLDCVIVPGGPSHWSFGGGMLRLTGHAEWHALACYLVVPGEGEPTLVYSMGARMRKRCGGQTAAARADVRGSRGGRYAEVMAERICELRLEKGRIGLLEIDPRHKDYLPVHRYHALKEKLPAADLVFTQGFMHELLSARPSASARRPSGCGASGTRSRCRAFNAWWRRSDPPTRWRRSAPRDNFRDKGVQPRPIHAHGIDLVTDGPHAYTDHVGAEPFERVFKPGMVFVAEPNPITADGQFGIFLSHTFIVTESESQGVDEFLGAGVADASFPHSAAAIIGRTVARGLGAGSRASGRWRPNGHTPTRSPARLTKLKARAAPGIINSTSTF